MIKKTITEEKNILIILLIYTILLLFFCSKMSPLYPLNEWSDINLYFNMGKALFNGRTIYSEAFDHKGALIFFIYGIGYLISNTSFLGMYIIEVIMWTAMLFAAYFTARLFVDKIYALVVALAYALLVLSHTEEGGSAEEFIIVLETISLFFFIKYFKNKNSDTHNPKVMLLHGLICASVFFIKFNLILFWFFPLLAIFIGLIMKKEYQSFLYNAIAFIGGFLIITIPICIYFIANGALSEAWDIYIILNKSYAKTGSLFEIIELLAVRFYLRLRFEPLEFLIILIGAIYFPYKYIRNKWGAISIALSFISLYVIIFMTTGYVYYYSIPYYIFCVLGLTALCKYVNLGKGKITYILAVIIFLFAGINQKSFFGYQFNQLIKGEVQPSYVDEFESIIAKEKNPTFINLGLNLSNSLFTKLDITPTVKYFIAPNLKHEIYPEMREEQTRYIENKEVEFIAIASDYDEYEYFINLPAMTHNYRLVHTANDKTQGIFHYLFQRID